MYTLTVPVEGGVLSGGGKIAGTSEAPAELPAIATKSHNAQWAVFVAGVQHALMRISFFSARRLIRCVFEAIKPQATPDF
tara:strand:+ start:164 stop:403 length:240 start_codon:yes stop_codon:yes gene_type:complete